MTEAIVTTSLIAMFVIAFAANLRLPEADNLPMHFNIRFRPTWSAPRLIALLTMPLITAIIMICLLVFESGNPETATGLKVLAPFMIAAHLLHIYLISRHLKNQS
ncbi:hypothetical protein [Altererythrobacter sp. ZODW24]|uniref:hypothetical protein n=1 Tax=Altererythrobacter sp. ZODW24 TaxID=2185142 RepID=UPI000DF72686|nr:hypothetical protein [Altererythrobacter sp. ZODW24]